MQNAVLTAIGVACLFVGWFIFFKVAPRDGEEPAPWLQNNGAAMGITLVVIMFGTFGVGLLIKGFMG